MRYFLCLLAGAFTLALSAQRLDYRPGELIVQFGADVDAKVWLDGRAELTGSRPLGKALNIWLVTFDWRTQAASEIRRRYWADPAVELVQRNHFVSPRATPNDPRYDDQWHHFNVGQLNGVVGADHNVEAAWDVTTGGVTANGDTIVVAILDDGVDTDHTDLAANLWRNHDEIPGNGVDDDDNGYVDDYFGFNTARDTSDIEAGEFDDHGTPVAGLVGAVGNNGIGVAGTNWDVKLMIVRNAFLNSEAEVLQAYSYVLEARQDYDASAGERGAYVVATNASWGRDFGNPDDAPVWCGLYDRLGEAGILSAGATINGDVDVDEDGDLPTACPSDYLIAVTNLNTNDQKVNSAGFGAQSIDLGAYGAETFTTAVGNSYGYFGGTSAATPNVAGAIALLYSSPCANFGELLVADPKAAALLVKETLLTTAAPNESLAGITVSGGRLDIGAAMSQLNAACDVCLAPTSFSVSVPDGSATELLVDWRTTTSLGAANLRYRLTGTDEWTTVTAATPPFTFTGPACTSYDFQLTGACGNEAVATEVLTVATDGCCVIPEDFTVTPNDGFFSARWSELLAGRFYRVRYRAVGDTVWRSRTSNSGFVDLSTGILDCTDYEFEFQTDCDTFSTQFGSRMEVLSFGCGACNEEDYCTPDEYDNAEEWIAAINVGDVLVNASQAEPGAYRSFGEISARALVRGGVYPVVLTPGFADIERIEEFRIYVDWNQDGRLSSSEIAVEVENEEEGEPAFGVLTVPDDADLLLTRMRIMMQFRGVRGGSCPVTTGFGEAEDYCISIVEATGCPPPGRLSLAYDGTADATRATWSASDAPGGTYRLRYRLADTEDPWTEVDVTGNTTDVADLNLCGTYDVEIASLCDSVAGEYAAFAFDNTCTSDRRPALSVTDWRVFPNPTSGLTSVTWSGALHPRQIRVYDLNGRQVSVRNVTGVRADLDVSSLNAGLYVIRLITADGRSGARRLVVR